MLNSNTIIVTEPTTPLNNADQGGSFFLFKEIIKVELDKDKSKIKPPITFKEQVELLRSRKLHLEDSEYAEKTFQQILFFVVSSKGISSTTISTSICFVSSPHSFIISSLFLPNRSKEWTYTF